MVVRCDQGGLGNQTFELWRRLQPERTLLVHVNQPRGDEYPEKYHGAPSLFRSRGDVVDAAVGRAFADGLDTIMSVETFYGEWYRDVSARTILVTNPELHASYPDVVVLPTQWERRRVARAQVIPHPTPIAPSSWVKVRDGRARTFLHQAAPAMLDRNGTRAVLEACQMVDADCRLIIRAPGTPPPLGMDAKFTVGRVEVGWDSRRVRDWWSNYPPMADCLVLPRRYGGLCMPALEAAALGLPSLMTVLEPNMDWPGPRCLTKSQRKAQMKGGTFSVYEPDVEHLAASMTSLATQDDRLREYSLEALAWAERQGWECVGHRWESLCA